VIFFRLWKVSSWKEQTAGEITIGDGSNMREIIADHKKNANRLLTTILAALFLFSFTAVCTDQEDLQKPEYWEERLEKLRSIPYTGLSEDPVDINARGVILHQRDKAFAGYNFFCTYNSGEVFLLDMDGNVVHQWTYPFKGCKTSEQAVLLENGDILVINCHELFRLDWNSNVIWRKQYPVHHDVAASPDGSLYMIVASGHRNYRKWRVNFDGLVHVSADGEEIDRWFTYKHLDEIKRVCDTRSFLDTILDSLHGDQASQVNRSLWEKREQDRQSMGGYGYFHTNTVSVLQANELAKKDARFQPGNLLVCFRNVNQIVILEKDTYRVLWSWGEGQLEWPHHPTMLESGHILVFDNGVERGHSRVVEIDPDSGKIVWEYKDEPPEDFYSKLKGSAQRLPNGNTLICESQKGHVIEVTKEGQVVWEWLNPDVVGKRRKHVYRMLRFPRGQVEELMGSMSP